MSEFDFDLDQSCRLINAQFTVLLITAFREQGFGLQFICDTLKWPEEQVLAVMYGTRDRTLHEIAELAWAVNANFKMSIRPIDRRSANEHTP